jgi:NADPH2:quinone reductase
MNWLFCNDSAGAGGGMGSIAVQLGVALGCKVIAAASSDDKLKAAKELGAHYTINYTRENLKQRVESITDQKMCDICYEVCGSPIFEEAFRCLAGGGRMLIIGFATGKIPQIPANLVLVKGVDIIGVRSGAEMMLRPQLAQEIFTAMQQLTARWDRILAPRVQNVYGIEQFQQAYKDLNEKKVIGKAAIVWNKEANTVPNKTKAKL